MGSKRPVTTDMKGIIVFDEAGIPLASIGFENLKVNPGLFSSFMSAMQTFACSLSGGEVKELEYGNVRILLGHARGNQVITIHSIVDNDADWNHGTVLELIESNDFALDDNFLSLLRELLSDARVSIEEAKRGINGVNIFSERHKPPIGE